MNESTTQSGLLYYYIVFLAKTKINYGKILLDIDIKTQETNSYVVTKNRHLLCAQFSHFDISKRMESSNITRVVITYNARGTNHVSLAPTYVFLYHS